MAEKNGFNNNKFTSSWSSHECHLGAVVKELLVRADKPGSTPAHAVLCFIVIPFFFFWPLSFNTIFLFGLFSFILTADPADHALGSIYIWSSSPESYFGKGISKTLDLHTGQVAYDQKKTISCQDMPSSETAEVFSVLVDIMAHNTQYTRNCTN